MNTVQMTFDPPLEEGREFTGEFRRPREGEFYYWNGKAAKAYCDRSTASPIVARAYVTPSWIKPGTWILNVKTHEHRVLWYLSDSPELTRGNPRYLDEAYINFTPPPYSPYQVPLVKDVS